MSPELRRPPRLRTLLFALHLLLLALPMGGIAALRLYDSHLVRGTEAELVSQGVVLAAVVQRELAPRLAGESFGHPLPKREAMEDDDERFHPIPPRLDLARHPVGPPAPEAAPAEGTADPRMTALGESLGPLLLAVQETTLAGLRIVDPEGRVVASSGAEGGLSLAHRQEVQAALAGRATSTLRRRTPSTPSDTSRPAPPLDSLSRRTGVRVVVTLPVVHDERVWGAVVLARTPPSVLRDLFENRRYFLPGTLLLLLAAALLAAATARYLGRPLERLAARSEAVARGEGQVEPLEHPGTLEVQRISGAVSAMARTLERRAEAMATFATHVSHELKTPLTSIHGTIELLRDHLDTMSPEEVDRFLTMLEKDATRLELLVVRLLELARAEALHPGGEDTRLAEGVERLVEQFRLRELTLDVSHLPEVTVGMAPEIVHSVLSNLVENAFQHGGEGVQVRLEAEASEGAVTLRVIDDGRGISEGNRDRVFDRFFTTARDRGGSGMGLPIVRALAEAHGGIVELRSEVECTVAELRLPTHTRS